MERVDLPIHPDFQKILDNMIEQYVRKMAGRFTTLGSTKGATTTPSQCPRKKASLESATYIHVLRTFNNEIFATISPVIGTILGAFFGQKS